MNQNWVYLIETLRSSVGISLTDTRSRAGQRVACFLAGAAPRPISFAAGANNHTAAEAAPATATGNTTTYVTLGLLQTGQHKYEERCYIL